MDFRRKLSSGGESFSEGTSRFFSSVLAKKNGLMNDLSNKFESVGASAASLMKGSSSGSSLSDSEGPVFTENDYNKTTAVPDSVEDTVKTTDSYKPVPAKRVITAEINPIQKSQKDKENEQLASTTVDRNQNAAGKYHIRQSSVVSSGSSVNDDVNISSGGVNMSFDEPLYSPSSGSKISTPEKVGVGPSWKGKKTPPPIPPPPYNPNKTGRRSSRSSSCNSPRTTSGHSSDSEGRYEKYTPDEKVNADDRTKAPSLAATKRRSSTVDEMLFDDYVQPEPAIETKPEEKVISQNEAVNKRKTLLPMGDLISFDEPELEDFHPKRIDAVNDEKRREKSFPSVSSIESSEGVFEENALMNQTSVDSSEPEYERSSRRLDSMGSQRSWSSEYSLDSQPDDLTLECMGFMKQFVDKVFNPREDIPQIEKAKFGEFCQQVPGRQWFARYVNSQRVVSKKVDESIFFRLVQYFAVVLFECNESEDYVPAKNLMNMCFTFYHESRHGKQRFKNFLYSYLQEQPIWQSLRFWNAAFFDSVQNERARKPVCTSEDGHDSQTDDSMFQENITFGQLGTFTCNMRAFGLSKELCLEFLRKQSVIADLKEGHGPLAVFGHSPLAVFVCPLAVFGHSPLAVFGHSQLAVFVCSSAVFGHSPLTVFVCPSAVFGHSPLAVFVCPLTVFGHSPLAVFVFSLTVFGHSPLAVFVCPLAVFGHSPLAVFGHDSAIQADIGEDRTDEHLSCFLKLCNLAETDDE
ncbi:hypothetical protein ACF0H5_006744 [Mactra antiquata]